MNNDYALDIRKKIKTNDLIMVPSAAIVPFSNEKIMLQKRTDTGTWAVIGGGIQYHERIKETAIRELFEETNLECFNLKVFGIYSNFPIEYKNKDKVNAFTIAFVCEIKDKDVFKANDGETIEVKWFNQKQVIELNFWNEGSKEIALDSFKYLKANQLILK